MRDRENRVVSAYLRRKSRFGMPDMADMDAFLDWAEKQFGVIYPGVGGAIGIGMSDSKLRVKQKIRGDEGSLIYRVQGWPDTEIVITFDPKGEVEVSGELRGAKLRQKFRFNPGSMGISGGTFSDVYRYLEKMLPSAKVEFQVVDRNRGGSKIYKSEADLLRVYDKEGIHHSPSTREELQGLPKLKNMAGPMYNGRKGDVIQIRYEDWETQRQMSI